MKTPRKRRNGKSIYRRPMMTEHDVDITRIQPNDLRGYFHSELMIAEEFSVKAGNLEYARRVQVWKEKLTDDQCRAIVNWIGRHPKPATWRGGALSWIYEEMPFRFGLWRWWKP